jgi:hypothetical protein
MATEELELDSSLVIKNVGTAPFVAKYAPKRYFRIEPGKSRSVPREYAHMWFGDPSIGDPEERYHRMSQLRVLYGIMTPTQDADKFPKVQVYDFDTDQRVYMLFEDPDGTKAIASAASGETDQIELDPQVAALRDEIRQMRAAFTAVVGQLHQQNGEAESLEEPAEPDEPIDPVDGAVLGAETPAAQVAEEAFADAIDALDGIDATATEPTPSPETASQDRPIRVRG